MRYLAENVDKRLDPRLLMPGVQTIVSVALSYSPSHSLRSSLPLSVYALGKDYHDVMKTRLHALASAIEATAYRAFCDTAPVMERYWAARSRLGWLGRNRQLIVPHVGSMVFLGELFLTDELDAYDDAAALPIEPHRCNTCKACAEACPTHALSADMDCHRCLSYHTIENRGDIPAEIAEHLGGVFYGCDRCTLACPHNRQSEPTTIAELQPNPALLSMTDADWQSLTIDDYRRLFRGSAVKRAKYDQLMRNIRLAILGK